MTTGRFLAILLNPHCCRRRYPKNSQHGHTHTHTHTSHCVCGNVGIGDGCGTCPKEFEQGTQEAEMAPRVKGTSKPTGTNETHGDEGGDFGTDISKDTRTAR